MLCSISTTLPTTSTGRAILALVMTLGIGSGVAAAEPRGRGAARDSAPATFGPDASARAAEGGGAGGRAPAAGYDPTAGEPPLLWSGRGPRAFETTQALEVGGVLALGLGATALTGGVVMLLDRSPLEKVRFIRPGGGLGVALRLRF